MRKQEKQWQLQEEERLFLELSMEMTHVLGENRPNYRRWTFKEIHQQVSKALQLNATIRTLNDYKSWRASLKEGRSAYPSIDTIQRLMPQQYEQIDQLFSQGRVGRPLKWSQEKIWECLNEAYQQSKVEDQPFSPKYYRNWQQGQEKATPSYSTINELVGSFKEIRNQLDVQDGRFAQNSSRPKRWTEDLVWGFLEKAYRDLRGQNLEFTQQAFIQWRDQQLEQNVKIPALSTIKSVLGGGGFSVWKQQLKG